jgi:ABC-type transporter Mla subunit MlaD
MFNTKQILAAVQLIALGYIIYQQRKQEKIMSTVPAGEAALQAQVASLSTDVQANTAVVQQLVTAYAAQSQTIATLQNQVAGLNQEDTQVQAIANTVQTLADDVAANTASLNAALNPPAPTPAS